MSYPTINEPAMTGAVAVDESRLVQHADRNGPLPVSPSGLLNSRVLTLCGCLLAGVLLSWSALAAPLLQEPVFVADGGFEAAVAKGDLIFLAARDPEPEVPDIRIFRLKKGGGAVQIGTYFTTGSTRGVALKGDYLYLANGSEGLEVVDVRRPREPRQAAILPLEGYSHNVVIEGKLAYLAAGFGGMYIVDITNPRKPRLLSTYRAFQMPTEVAAEDEGEDGLFAKQGQDQGYYDADDLPAYEGGESDTPFSEFAEKEGVLDLAVADGRGYLAYASAGLHIVDITDPRKPRALGSVKLDRPAETVQVQGTTLQVTAGIAGINAIDVSDTAHPRVTGQFRTNCYPQQLARSGDYAYVADGFCGQDGLLVLSLGSGSTPNTVVETHQGAIGNVAVSDGRLFSMGLGQTQVFSLPR